jgi:ABC-type microcin C transport system duplicated ATPase subunit YejF
VSLDPLRRVGAEIAEPMRLRRTVPRAQVAARTVELLRRVGLPEPEARARPPGANRQPVLVHEPESHRLLRTRLLSGAINECRYAS